MRDIDKEIYVKNVKKPIDYSYQYMNQQSYDGKDEDIDIPIVDVDPEEPVDAIDEEIRAMMESLTIIDRSDIDPDKED